ncbi:KilA-N domain-containing protein [Acinetobacter variabilis]|uniref:KilA-N domain-containing protein n=1 Tax=Acinetobacter variabilis TaxID=70346 RepID=UPI0021CD7FEB|nr:KilA-N domain-containing protein [Acinetobacter variabilis]MCU4365643.1 KilA-N domain-containing protein [Acinetobacter variabilis]
MSNLTQNLVNPNTQPLVIGEFSIRQDEDGRYCLNDLHKASGYDKKHQPAYFIRNQQTKDLIAEIENPSNGASANLQMPAVGKVNDGKNNGTYVVKELVYSYAMWISAKFHLQVIRAYDAMVMQFRVKARQTISPEQQALLHEIVSRRSQGERKIFAEMWARHNRHFKIPRYAELLEIHFPEAVHYLETMDLKAKVEKQEVKSLPYPQEVIQVAQQISQEFNNSKYDAWHVSARNGVLTAMPLPPGFYPTMDIAEFTKRFDSVLDLLYGTDTLRVGRHFLRERNSN